MAKHGRTGGSDRQCSSANPWKFNTLSRDRLFYKDRTTYERIWSWDVKTAKDREGKMRRVIRAGSTYYLNQDTGEVHWIQKRTDLLDEDRSSKATTSTPRHREGLLPRIGKVQKRTVKKELENARKTLNKGKGALLSVRDYRYSDPVNNDLTRESFKTMDNHNFWVNDECINFFICQLSNALMKPGTGTVRVHICSTYFLGVLRRWVSNDAVNLMKKLGLQNLKYSVEDCECLIVPVHASGNHWALAVLDRRYKTIRYYDSLEPGYSTSCWEDELLRFVVLLWKLESSEDWKIVVVESIPKQNNFHDCGVFMLKYLDDLVFERPFRFCQDDMESIREQISHAILSTN